MKRILSNIAAIVWFVTVLLWVLLVFPLLIPIIFSDLSMIVESGFGGPSVGYTFVVILGLIFGITMLVPPLRICFRKLPWLFPYITIFMMDLAIVSIAEVLLNIGYSVQNESRHTLFLILTAVQILVCRIIQCIWCHKKSMRIPRDAYES